MSPLKFRNLHNLHELVIIPSFVAIVALDYLLVLDVPS
jgi:hypothetical protein